MARKQRNIYKRNDNRYEARYIKSRDENGKAIYGAVYAKTYAEVKEKLKTVAVAENTKVSKNSYQTVSQLTNTYLKTIKFQIKQSTYWVYNGYIKNHIKPCLGNIQCRKINQEILQDFANKKLKSGLSVATVQSVFSFLRKALSSILPCKEFEIKLPKRTQEEVQAFSLSEQKRLEFAATESDSTNRLGIFLCLYTGIRIGELCSLMWKDIDFERGQLNVRHTLQRIKNENGKEKTKLIFQSPKSASSQRIIPLQSFLLTMLAEEHEKSDSEHVISKDGGVIEPRNLQYRFKRLLIKADLPPSKFHITRHTFVTRALEKGFDIKTLSEILGHASPIVTLKKYAHVIDEHKRKSMESLADVFINAEHGQKSGQDFQ